MLFLSFDGAFQLLTWEEALGEDENEGWQQNQAELLVGSMYIELTWCGSQREQHKDWRKLVSWTSIPHISMPPDRMIGGLLFFSCLSVFLSTLTFAITFEQ